MSEMFPEVRAMLYEFYSRFIIFFVLSVFAIVNMGYLNSEYEAGNIAKSDIGTLNMAFEIIGFSLFVYVTLPLLKYGYQQRQSLGGKLMLTAMFISHPIGIYITFLS